MSEFVGPIISISYSREKKARPDAAGDAEVFGFKESTDLFSYLWGGVVAECARPNMILKCKIPRYVIRRLKIIPLPTQE